MYNGFRIMASTGGAMWPRHFRYPIIIGRCWVRAEGAKLLMGETLIGYIVFIITMITVTSKFTEKNRFDRSAMEPRETV